MIDFGIDLQEIDEKIETDYGETQEERKERLKELVERLEELQIEIEDESENMIFQLNSKIRKIERDLKGD